MKTNQKLTEKYFKHLTKKYCKGKLITSLKFEFVDDINKIIKDKDNVINGATSWNKVQIMVKVKVKKKILGIIPWWTTKEVLIKENHFTIYFLKEYDITEKWLYTLFHEFTHLFLNLHVDKHDCEEERFDAIVNYLVKTEDKDLVVNYGRKH